MINLVCWLKSVRNKNVQATQFALIFNEKLPIFDKSPAIFIFDDVHGLKKSVSV